MEGIGGPVMNQSPCPDEQGPADYPFSKPFAMCVTWISLLPA